MTNFLHSVKDALKKAGMQDSQSVAVQLRDAATSKNRTRILRAFHNAIYSRFEALSDTLPIIKSYLSNVDPFVRYVAAQTLYTAGDHTGYDALISMVATKDPIPDGTQDLRIEAAQTLARFREQSAADAIMQLYVQTSGSGLLSALATLGDQDVVGELEHHGYFSNEASIVRYGKLQVHTFAPQIEATFQSTTSPEIKSATAWTLSQLGQENYVGYLTGAAQAAIDAKPTGSESFDSSTDALRYLGSVHSAEAVNILKEALNSKNPVAVQYAVVNLIYNQDGGFDAAKQVLLRELSGQQHMLGVELTLNIAANLDDPQIQAAGSEFGQRLGNDAWNYAVARKGWPIYNWIDSYVVKLK